MSEYQYYGFQAIDQPLSEDDMRWLRGLSTRAQITTTSFVNVYHWGDFRGNPIKLMERCFDAFVYVTNWGYRRFMLRLPLASFDAALAKEYCHRDGLSLRKKKDYVLLEFDRDDEPGEWEDWDDGSGWMASLTPLRSDLLDGDWRCLYLAWLSAIQTESLPDNAPEPPVPAGLKDLSAPLGAFADFLQINTELINVAAAQSESRAANAPPAGALKKWIRSLPVAEKESLLLKIAHGEEPNPCRSLIRSFKEAVQGLRTKHADEDAPLRRTVAEISEVWQQRVRAKQRRLAEQAEKERERKARAEARARKKHLDGIASRTSAVWKQVSSWIAKRTPKGYDRAVELLSDLKDAAAVANRTEEFDRRLQDLRERHASKPSLIRRLQKAEPTPSSRLRLRTTPMNQSDHSAVGSVPFTASWIRGSDGARIPRNIAAKLAKCCRTNWSRS